MRHVTVDTQNKQKIPELVRFYVKLTPSINLSEDEMYGNEMVCAQAYVRHKFTHNEKTVNNELLSRMKMLWMIKSKFQKVVRGREGLNSEVISNLKALKLFQKSKLHSFKTVLLLWFILTENRTQTKVSSANICPMCINYILIKLDL